MKIERNWSMVLNPFEQVRSLHKSKDKLGLISAISLS